MAAAIGWHARPWLTALVLGCAAAAAQSPSEAVRAVGTEGQEETKLLGARAPIDPKQIVVTFGTLLHDDRFGQHVISEVQSRYFGYMLDQTQRDDRWVFAGPIKGFTARYGRQVTTAWPDATPFLREDSRRNLSSLQRIRAPTQLAESENLRIYRYPARVGFDGQEYRIVDTLIVAYLPPQTGRRSAYVYRPVNGSYELYRLEPGRIPKEPQEASLVAVVGVATTETTPTQLFGLPILLPRHTYAQKVFRVFGGYNYEQSKHPLGPAIRFSGLQRKEVLGPFDAALDAYRQGTSLSEDQFLHAYRLISQAHEYLVEPSTKRRAEK